MKKLIVLTTLFVMAAAPAFAAEVVSTVGGKVLTATAPANSVISRMSKGVVLGAQYSSTGYALDTYHLQGTKFFGTAFDSTALYFKDVGTSATLVVPTSSVNSEAFGTDWTVM